MFFRDVDDVSAPASGVDPNDPAIFAHLVQSHDVKRQRPPFYDDDFEDDGEAQQDDKDYSNAPLPDAVGSAASADYATYDGGLFGKDVEDDDDAFDYPGGGDEAGKTKRGVKGVHQVFHYRVDEDGGLVSGDRDPSGIGAYIDDYSDTIDTGDLPDDG